MSKWKQYGDFIHELKNIDGIADYFYMVDSYGGVYPKDIIETMDLVKSNTNCPIGFHGHNNLELALVNTLTAIEHGAEIIDATILGMGRGAGNLKTELLLTVLNSKFGHDVNFNALGSVVNTFEGLLEKHQWGTNLPYMISGSNSLPQKDVMDWVTTRFYSLNSIIRALENQKNKVADNQSLPVFEPEHYTNVVIVGGGANAREHADGIIEFVKGSEDIVIIHASSKNAYLYKDLDVPQLFCLVGSEGHRLEKVFSDLGNFSGKCVLPPYPRKMGTYIPEIVADKAFELPAVEFTSQYKDSHTALALQTALQLNAKNIYITGYDGYQEGVVTQKERDLTSENEFLFSLFKTHSPEISLVSVTPTNYKKLSTVSLYENL
jgi:4-hydroxy 2-oxovalerate aldolase